MLKTTKRFVLQGEPTEVVILSPAQPLGELSYRDVHFKWNGVHYSATFILSDSAKNWIDLGDAPCGWEGKRIHVRDFKLDTLAAALDYICANDDLERCADVSEPFDREAVWVGMPPIDPEKLTPEDRENALSRVEHHLYMTLQSTIAFGLCEPDETKVLDWIRIQCQQIIRKYDAYADDVDPTSQTDDWASSESHVLACKRGEFKITVLSPTPGLPPIDDCREVHIEIPATGRYRAVLFHFSDPNSNDPEVVMPADEWNVPAKWDDNQALFVPSFDIEDILAAIAYVLDNHLEDEVFEHEDAARF